MEEQQGPSLDPTTEESSKLPPVLPFKKRAVAEGEATASEPEPEPQIDYKKRRKERMEILRNKKARVREMQEQAYFAVLRAFAAESKAVSRKRIMIIRDLMMELKVPYQQHKEYKRIIRRDHTLQQLWVDSTEEEEEEEAEEEDEDSDEDEDDDDDDDDDDDADDDDEEEPPRSKEKLPPLRIKLKRPSPQDPKSQEEPKTATDKHGENDKPSTPGTEPSSSAGGASSSGNWGKVSPESLIGRVIRVRLPGDDDYIKFTIVEYDEDQEEHRLETDSETMEDPCSWVDLRHIPSQDVMWDGEDPGISEEACSLRPGQTILRETSTCRRESSDDGLFKVPPLPSKKADSKEPLKEMRKVTSEDPGELDKGQGTLRDEKGIHGDAVEKIAGLTLKDKGGEQTEPHEATAMVGKPDHGEGDSSNNS